MTIAIDIGNTNIDVALFEDEKLIRLWRVFTDSRRTGDEYASVLRGFFRDEGIKPATALESVTISSVVPSLTESFIMATEMISGKKPIVVSPAHFEKLPLKIPSAEMGSDLVCDALEAFYRTKSACITVDFGTALTFTAVRSTGEIAGVSIAPGLGTAINSLFQQTAQLPQVPLEAPSSVLGLNTTHCIQSGVILGYKGLVEYIVNQIKSEMNQKYGETNIKVIATGGLSKVLAAQTTIFDSVDKFLTVSGVRRFGEFVKFPSILDDFLKSLQF